MNRYGMAEKFGWSLEYVDSLSLQDRDEFIEYEAVKEGLQKGYRFLRGLNGSGKSVGG